MNGTISARAARATLPAVALTLALGLFQACGSSGGLFGTGGAAGSLNTGGTLDLAGTGSTFDPVGSAGLGTSAGGTTATGGGATAAGGACTGANCAPVGPGKPSGATCTLPDQCQSGRCEPVTGKPTEACLSACFADGVACARALDCCSTGCLDGTCGGQCKVVGEGCKLNAECCSNVCDAGECQVDLPNRDCRPTGEDCTKGSGSGCCNTCNKETGRCDFGPDTCFAQGVACAANAQCCHGACLGGKCTTPCVAQAGACAGNADCCSVSCVGGKCAPPPSTGVGGGTAAGGGASICTLTGDACTDSPSCCSGICFGGFCEAPVR